MVGQERELATRARAMRNAPTEAEKRLARLGYKTLRITNADVMRNLEGVSAAVLAVLTALPDRWPHPNPSPEGEGL